MEEIKEILGPEHVIFKITGEIVDLEEETDILEKIGCLIDSGEVYKNNEEHKAFNQEYKSNIAIETYLDELLCKELVPYKATAEENLIPEKNQTLRSSATINPFKEPEIVENIGWTDWIRSFIIYSGKKQQKQKRKAHEVNPADYELSYEELKTSTRNRSALPRLLPEYSVPDDVYRVPLKEPKQIIFGGCAGMYHYFLGIASVLQEKFDMSDVVFGCVSGGSFPALALILDLPVKELHETWNKEILRDLNKSSLKAFSRLNGIVFEKSKKYIPLDAHIRAKDRLFISLTEFPSLKNHIVHYWQTIDSLLDCIQASCFIPIFDKRFWTVFDKTKYVDGGLSNNKPIPYPHSPYIYITTDRWREIPLHWYWCYTCESWSDQLFAWGIQDTLSHLDEFTFLQAKL